MAQQYAKVKKRFWFGTTGRQLFKLGPDAQLVAAYLVTGPSANMIGMYLLPLEQLQAHVSLPLERASAALRAVCSTGFAMWDEATEYVFLPKALEKDTDSRPVLTPNHLAHLHSLVIEHRSCTFMKEFYRLYATKSELPEFESLGEKIEESPVSSHAHTPTPTPSATPTPNPATGLKKKLFDPLTIQFPASLSTPAFAAAWSVWIQYLRECRVNTRETSLVKSLEHLATVGEALAIEAIELAIRSNWKSLHPRVPSNGAAKARSVEEVVKELRKRREGVA